jgi:hypothetical protein
MLLIGSNVYSATASLPVAVSAVLISCYYCYCTVHFTLLSKQVVSPHSPPSVLQQMAVVEGQMTWLVYISGAIVGGYSWSDSGSAEGEEVIDAR